MAGKRKVDDAMRRRLTSLPGEVKISRPGEMDLGIEDRERWRQARRSKPIAQDGGTLTP